MHSKNSIFVFLTIFLAGFERFTFWFTNRLGLVARPLKSPKTTQRSDNQLLALDKSLR